MQSAPRCRSKSIEHRIDSKMQESATTSSDGDLVAEVRQGNSIAEATLYEKYSARIYFLALSEVHSRSDAEDIRAETFLRVIQALRQDKLRSPTSLPSFIVGIALNVVREHARRGYKTQQFDGNELKVAGDVSAEMAFLNDETRKSVREVISQLKPREREFLRLYYYEELSKEEISRSLGIKEERMRLIKSRALKAFHSMYQRVKKG